MNGRFEKIEEEITSELKDSLRRVYNQGYSAGLNAGKEKYGESRDFSCCTRASDEDIEKYGPELFGWCSCGNPIEGRWVGAIKFCPWCGKIIEWKSRAQEDSNA